MEFISVSAKHGPRGEREKLLDLATADVAPRVHHHQEQRMVPQVKESIDRQAETLGLGEILEPKDRTQDYLDADLLHLRVERKHWPHRPRVDRVMRRFAHDLRLSRYALAVERR